MKDDWEALKTEVQTLEQNYKPSDGDAENHLEMTESVVHDTDQEMNRLSDRSHDETQECLTPVDYIITKSNNDFNEGKSFFGMFSSDPVITKTNGKDGTTVVVDDTKQNNDFFLSLVGVLPALKETSSGLGEEQKRSPNEGLKSTSANEGTRPGFLNKVWSNNETTNERSEMQNLYTGFHEKFNKQIQNME